VSNIVLITGVSCSGKDFLLGKVEPFLLEGFQVVNFGEEVFKLLRSDYPGLKNRDQLKELSPREILAGNEAISQRLVQGPPLIVNTHVVMRSGGDLVSVPDSIYRLAPRLFIHISAPAEEIVKRRRANGRNRIELEEPPGQIVFHQDFSVWATSKLAQDTGASFLEIWNSVQKTQASIAMLRRELARFP